MNKLSIESITQTEVTPEFLAKAFWDMDSRQQCAFFSALAKETKGSDAYGYGEMQWCHLRDDLKKDAEAMAQYQALTIWGFDFLPNVAQLWSADNA